MPDLELANVCQVFPGDPPVNALRGVTVRIATGEFVAIQGPSGSGKSTLLNDLALLHVPTSGDYLIDGESLTTASEGRRAATRSRLFGFVFQGFHLLDARPTVDSVELGLFYRGVPRRRRRTLALEALREVGLEEKAYQRAGKLSGGERQRVAIARALAADAPIIVADEPTGNLDSVNGEMVVSLLSSIATASRTVLLVTHDASVAARARRRITLRDGVVQSDVTSSMIAFGALDAHEGAGVGQKRQLGRDSVVRVGDLVRDGMASLASRRGKTIGLVAAVAVAVGLAVATLGMSETASAQVSDRFDAMLNTEVTVTQTMDLGPDAFAPATPQEADTAMMSIAGVAAAGTVTGYAPRELALSSKSPSRTTDVYAITEGVPRAGRLTIEWADPENPGFGDGEVLLGAIAADELSLGPIVLKPAVSIDGRAYAVAGIVTESNREIRLLSGVLVSAVDGAVFGEALETTQLIVTVPGAALSVARQAPLVLRPTAPEALDVVAPPDPQQLRAGIQADVRMTLLILTGVAGLAATIGLANSMILSIIERSREFGLRRAIGARPRHIVGSVLVESALIGIGGGAGGLVLGLSGILFVTVANRWIPVFDLSLGPLAVLGGVIVGSVGGVVSAVRAARIQPADALRA